MNPAGRRPSRSTPSVSPPSSPEVKSKGPNRLSRSESVDSTESSVNTVIPQQETGGAQPSTVHINERSVAKKPAAEFEARIQKVMGELTSAPVKFSPLQGAKALAEQKSEQAAMMLLTDQVGMSQINEVFKLRQALKITTAQTKDLVAGRAVKLTSQQQGVLRSKGRTIEDLKLPEFVQRGRVLWSSWLETLYREADEERRFEKSNQGLGGWFFNLMATTQKFELHVNDLKKDHARLFTDPSHSREFLDHSGVIKPGEFIEAKHKGAEYLAADIFSVTNDYPQYTTMGIKEAMRSRKQQIKAYGLHNDYPTFVVRFHGEKDLPSTCRNTVLALTDEEALRLAELCPGLAPQGYEYSQAVQKEIEAVFQEILARYEAESDRIPPSLRLPAGDPILNNPDYMAKQLAQFFVKHPQECFRYKNLPPQLIARDFKKHLGALNNGLQKATTLKEVCDVLGEQIPPMMQAHPFSQGNRYLFGQLVQRILLEHGYPIVPFLNFKLMGMVGKEELSELLLQHIAAHSLSHQEIGQRAKMGSMEKSEPCIIELVETLKDLQEQYDFKSLVTSRQPSIKRQQSYGFDVDSEGVD